MIKVTHLISSLCPSYGGPSIALAGLANAQLRQGLEVNIIASYSEKDDLSIAKSLESNGVNVFLAGPSVTSWRWSNNLKEIIAKETSDSNILHLHGVFEAIQYFSSSLPIPYIIRPCGMLDSYSLNKKNIKKNLYLKVFARKILNNTSALHFTTEQEKQGFAFPFVEKRSFVIPNGIPPLQTIPTTAISNNKIPWNQFVLFMSRVTPKKRLDLVLKAISLLPSEEQKLVVAGPIDETYRNDIESLVDSLNLATKVVFTGNVTGHEKLSLLDSATCLVLPSEHENFANIILEALQRNLACILTIDVALADLVIKCSAGTIVDRDPQNISDAIKHILANPLNQQSKEKIKNNLKNYSWTSIASKIASKYKTILEL